MSKETRTFWELKGYNYDKVVDTISISEYYDKSKFLKWLDKKMNNESLVTRLFYKPLAFLIVMYIFNREARKYGWNLLSLYREKKRRQKCQKRSNM